MKGSLVRLPLHRIRRHWTNHLSLYFHVTSTMMSRAPPAVARSPVLRQNWEILTWLASWWSKMLDVDTCPQTVFIRSSVSRHKPTNLHPLCFEAKMKKLSRWFWGLSGSSTPGTMGYRLQPKILDTTGTLQQQMAGEPYTPYQRMPHHSRLKRRGYQPKKN
jgi:hypothetical protein